MSSKAQGQKAWWARGLLFENCSCRSVCPGHVHFSQPCTYERCVGYWAVRFDEGRYGDVALDGVRAMVSYDSPQHMIEGDWTQLIVIDEQATASQRDCLETIFTGGAGGPWSILAGFVGKRLPTRFLPVRIEDQGQVKRVTIDGLLDSTIEGLRGRDRSRPVTFENMFNQIHAPSQVIAKGATRYDDGAIRIATDGTHALFSDFYWKVSGA